MEDGLGPGTGIADIKEEINTNTVITSDTKLHFRDAGIYLQSDSDGNLLLQSDDSIEVDADGTGDVIKLKLADNAGANGVIIEDSDTFPITRFDSKGNIKNKGKIQRIQNL